MDALPRPPLSPSRTMRTARPRPLRRPRDCRISPCASCAWQFGRRGGSGSCRGVRRGGWAASAERGRAAAVAMTSTDSPPNASNLASRGGQRGRCRRRIAAAFATAAAPIAPSQKFHCRGFKGARSACNAGARRRRMRRGFACRGEWEQTRWQHADSSGMGFASSPRLFLPQPLPPPLRPFRCDAIHL
eukprot:353445-Chlamydomonas_euryale.AAC.2